MGPSKVYFTDMRALPGTNLQQKLKRLILKAGIGQIDFQDKYAAIKIHFGEPGNLSYLRPNFAKTVADAVKELGGRPFLTDCNTLYVGRRKNALDHIEAAYENGLFALFHRLPDHHCRRPEGDRRDGRARAAAANTSGRPISAAP